MKKTIPAFFAALLITVILGAGMFVIGQGALGASTIQAAAETTTNPAPESLAQMEQAIEQYQAREVQYQTELNAAIERIEAADQQLSQANQQIQEYQNLLAQLQNSGLITITSDGSVTTNQPFFAQRGDRPERNH